MFDVKTRIGPITAFFMIGVALIYDGTKAFIELITFGFLGWLINPFINVWAQLTFWFWFTFLGVSFFKAGKMQGAKIAAMGVPSFIGLIPWIGSLPYWTSGVATNIAVVYTEDLLEALSPQTLKVMAKIARSKGNKNKLDKTPQTGAKKDLPKTKPDIKTKDDKIDPKSKDNQPPEKATETPEPKEERPKEKEEQKEKKPEQETKKESLDNQEQEPVRDNYEEPTQKTEPSKLDNFANYAETLAKKKERGLPKQKDQDLGYSEFNEGTGEMDDVEEEDWPSAV